MAARRFLLNDPAKPEPLSNGATRDRIDQALLALMAKSVRINHDAVAERAGVSRRTVYRYYPDREALLEGLWAKLSAPSAGPGGVMPANAGDLIARLGPLFRGFDEQAAAMTVAMASPEGRTMRNNRKEWRTAGFRKALAGETAHLDEPARTHAVAVVQLLNSGFAWREMRDQWDMDGDAIAAATGWAIEVLLRELKAGGGPK